MRVAVLFPGALGDLCLLAPALGALVAGGAHVKLGVQRLLQPIAALLLPSVELGPPVDGILVASLFAAEPAPELLRWLRDADRVHAWLARGDADGAVDVRLRGHGIAVAWHAVPRYDADRHAGDDYAADLGHAGPLAAPRASAPVVPGLVLPWRAPGARRVLLHPGSGGVRKRWDAAGFRLVVDALAAADREPLVLLGPAEEGEAEAWRAGNVQVLAGLDLVSAAAAIASAPVWIGNDSGMSHLAGALGRRGVVLFGPTRARRWRPRGGALTPIETTGRTLDGVARAICAGVLAPGHVA